MFLLCGFEGKHDMVEYLIFLDESFLDEGDLLFQDGNFLLHLAGTCSRDEWGLGGVGSERI